MAYVDAKLEMEIFSQASTVMEIDLDMGITKIGIYKNQMWFRSVTGLRNQQHERTNSQIDRNGEPM